MHRRALILGLVVWLSAVFTGCRTAAPTALPTAAPQPTAFPTEQVQPTRTLEPPTATAEPTAVPTGVPTATATPDPYGPYTIEALRQRPYGGGAVEVIEVLAENSWFTRYLFRYPSDGLWIYGFLNVPVPDGPAGSGPYPVIIALHGYIDPAIYETIDYTTGYADALARAGYIVFHPNLRGYPPSDDGDNLFRVGMAVDVLNLIALARAGDVEGVELVNARLDRIGLWGHSMGGGVSTRVLTVTESVQAAVLYAAMSGDEAQNYAAISLWSDGERGQEELAVPAEELLRISPMYYFEWITARVQIHHGRADELVPLAWSVQTCNELALIGLDVACNYYEGMPHTFYGEGNDQFIQNTIVFFDEVLKAP